jgi:hypothetical protein
MEARFFFFFFVGVHTYWSVLWLWLLKSSSNLGGLQSFAKFTHNNSSYLYAKENCWGRGSKGEFCGNTWVESFFPVESVDVNWFRIMRESTLRKGEGMEVTVCFCVNTCFSDYVFCLKKSSCLVSLQSFWSSLLEM